RLMHPAIPKKNLGDVVQQVGVVRVLSTQPSGAVAVIERCMDSVEIGDHLERFIEPANIPSHLRTDITEPLKVAPDAGVVVYTRDSRYLTGSGDMILIDRGSNSGLKVGDVLLAARARSFSVGSDNQKHPPTETTTYYLGQALVVRTDAQSATCRVLRSIEELKRGDTITQ
ncbi:MAG: hypothetical protein P4L11_03765, partial [Geothrix sp.]|nr:hypothetical protein [Geothrix sp.]